MTSFDEGTENNQEERGDRYIHDLALNDEHTTPDCKGDESSLTSMQNKSIIHGNNVEA